MKPEAMVLHAAIAQAHKNLRDYQKRCKHMLSRVKFSSSDPDGGCLHTRYRKEFTCADCGKRWTEKV